MIKVFTVVTQNECHINKLRQKQTNKQMDISDSKCCNYDPRKGRIHLPAALRDTVLRLPDKPASVCVSWWQGAIHLSLYRFLRYLSLSSLAAALPASPCLD